MDSVDIISFVTKLVYKSISTFVKKAAWIGYFHVSAEETGVISIEEAEYLGILTYKKSSFKVMKEINSYLFDKCSDEESVKKYLDCFIDNIKNTNPILFLMFQLDEVNSKIEYVVEKEIEIENTIEELKNNRVYKLDYLSIDDIDHYLKESTKEGFNDVLCVDLFDFKDNDFSNQIKNICESPGKTLISGQYQKETFFATLCELKKTFPNDYNDKVYIFDTYDNYFLASREKFGPNSIVINSFYNFDTIPIIKNCINIHIVSKWKYESSNIKLRPRLAYATRKALESNGLSSEQAGKVMQKCKNSFPAIYRELSNETDNYEVKIRENIKPDAIRTCLLINTFEETNSIDVEFVEKIYGKNISDLKDQILAPALIETPFVKELTDYSHKNITVLNYEDVFNSFKSLFQDFNYFFKFTNATKEAICKLPEKYQAELYLQYTNNSYSDCLLNSLFESLLMFKIHNKYKKQIDDVIECFIKWAEDGSDINRYKYLADHLNIMAEISPELIIKKITKDINQNSGLTSLFYDASNNAQFFFSNNYYTKVLWSIEKLLFIDSQKESAILNLFNLFRKNINYKMANSPKDSLQKFFVAWMNTSPAGIEEKKTLCAKLFEIDDKAAWDIFINLIYSGGGETITPLCEPRYISYRHFESRLPTKDIYNLYIFYENAINEHAKTANQFKQLFEKKSFLYFGEQAINDFINRVKNFCDNSPDDEKEIIIQSIREFVHKHREFQDAGWSASEKTIAKFENLISQIELKNKELGYVYLFDSWDVNVPHPIQYKHNNYSYEKTRETEQVYLDEQFNKFVKDKLDINYLYNYFNLHPDKLISDRFYYFSKRYEIDVKKRNIIEFIDLLQNKIVNSNNIFSFAGRDIYLNHYNDFYEIAKRIYESSKIDLFLSYFYAARIDCSDYGYMSIYNLLSDEDKARFWESIPNYIEIRQNDVDNLDFALSSLVATYLTQKKPNRYMSVLASFMYKYTKDDRGNLILKYLSLDYVKNLEIIVNAESWQIYEIIEMLHSDFAESDDQSIEAQIACVELLFIRNPDLREPIFLKNYLSRHPDLYYQFIFDEFINSKDNVSDKYRQNLLYLLHFGLKFCPGYIYSVFYEDIFDAWISDYKEKLFSTNYDRKDELFYYTLGKLLANATGVDGISLPSRIIEFIESIDVESNFNTFKRGFITEVFNSVGIRTIGDGSDLIALGKKHNETSEILKHNGCLNTSIIYKSISEDFIYQGELERKHAEDE